MSRLGVRAAAAAACAVLYFWLSEKAILEEAVAAVVVGALAAAAGSRVARAAGIEVAFPLRGVLAALRKIPTALVAETWLLLGPTLWRALVRPGSVRGRWVAVPYAPDDVGERLALGRRAIVVFAAGATPNSIPLEIDNERGLFALHQLAAVREPGADDAEWPF